MWETLKTLRPHRIGHGVRSAEDDALVAHLASARIHLELCPSSNAQIVESIRNVASHPIDRLHHAGVSVSVSTDTRALTYTTLWNEYALLQQHFGWSADDFLAANLAAVENAFLDGPTKSVLAYLIRRHYESGAQCRGI